VALALGGRSSDGGFRAVTMVDGDGALDRHSRAACSHPTSVFSMLRSRVLYATQTAYAMRTQTGTILPQEAQIFVAPFLLKFGISACAFSHAGHQSPSSITQSSRPSLSPRPTIDYFISRCHPSYFSLSLCCLRLRCATARYLLTCWECHHHGGTYFCGEAFGSVSCALVEVK
jgi:hypothetical protein